MTKTCPHCKREIEPSNKLVIIDDPIQTTIAITPQEAARALGSITSALKAKAARENGKKKKLKFKSKETKGG